MQSAPVQLTQVPPKPACTQILDTGPCADLWKNYHQAVQRATLNKLTTDQQQAQIKKLQELTQADSAAAVRQMQADATAILHATSYAHTQGLWQGAGIGVGATLLSFGLMFGLRKLRRNFGVTKKPKASAASA